MATTATEFPRRRKLTVTDYYCLAETGSLREEDRVELIEGEIIEMAPIGSRHAGTVDQLSRLMQRAVGELGLVRTQGPLRLGQYSEPEPDITLLKWRCDFYKSIHPGPTDVLLVVEVADTTLKFDREIKIPLYARHKIPEVWLVDLAAQRLAVYRQPRRENYRSVTEPAPLKRMSIDALPDISVDLGGLF